MKNHQFSAPISCSVPKLKILQTYYTMPSKWVLFSIAFLSGDWQKWTTWFCSFPACLHSLVASTGREISNLQLGALQWLTYNNCHVVKDQHVCVHMAFLVVYIWLSLSIVNVNDHSKNLSVPNYHHVWTVITYICFLIWCVCVLYDN